MTSCTEKSVYETLLSKIDNDQIPKEYGGASKYALGEHPYEASRMFFFLCKDEGGGFAEGGFVLAGWEGRGGFALGAGVRFAGQADGGGDGLPLQPR